MENNRMNDRKSIEALIADNAAEDVDYFEHFQALDLRHRSDVVEEGRRLASLVLEEEIEEESPLDSLFSSIAVAAQDVVFAALANALGANAGDVSDALEPFLKGWEVEPIGFDGLEKALAESRAFFEPRRNRLNKA